MSRYALEPEGWEIRAGPLVNCGRRSVGDVFAVAWGVQGLHVVQATSTFRIPGPAYSRIHRRTITAWERLWLYIDTWDHLRSAALADPWASACFAEVFQGINHRKVA